MQLHQRIRTVSIAALLAYASGGPALGADAEDYLRREQLDPALVAYEVTATTAQGRWSGANQDIQLRIIGSKPNEQPIMQTLAGPFDPNTAVRVFPQVEGRNIGFACSIELNTNGPDGWLPAAIDVAYLIQGREVGRTKFSNGGKNLPWIDTEGCGGDWQQQGAVNLARSGTATQSSTWPGGLAAKAIDGNNNGVWRGNTMAHTLVEDNPWWQLELQQRSTINRIVLWNRTEACCTGQLKDAAVTVWDKNPADPNAPAVWWRQTGVFNTNADGSIDTTKMVLALPDGIKGQMVTVQLLRGKTFLQLAEVEVWGLPNATGPAACPRPTRYFPDVVPPACDINRNISSQQQAQPILDVQDLSVRENDRDQLLTVNVNGFAQNAAGQSGEVMLGFATKVNGSLQRLEVDTSMSQGGVRAEVSKPVALRGNPARVQESMTIPYRAFRALSPRQEPYDVWVFAKLAVGSVEASNPDGVGVRIWIRP